MLYSSSRLRGLSRHYYETHQRHHSERGLVSVTHRWLLAMNYLLNCLCKCRSLILSEHYWLPNTQLTRLDEQEGKEPPWEPRTGRRSDPYSRFEFGQFDWGADILIKARAQFVTKARAMMVFRRLKGCLSSSSAPQQCAPHSLRTLRNNCSTKHNVVLLSTSYMEVAHLA